MNRVRFKPKSKNLVSNRLEITYSFMIGKKKLNIKEGSIILPSYFFPQNTNKFKRRF